MCELKELTIMVADSNSSSLKKMCDALGRLGLELLICAKDTKQGISFASKVSEKFKVIDILYCNSNLKGEGVPDFIQFVMNTHPGVIVITYSECRKPEAHIMSLFYNGSFDHIDFSDSFELNVKNVTSRWLRAAQLQYDYREKYG